MPEKSDSIVDEYYCHLTKMLLVYEILLNSIYRDAFWMQLWAFQHLYVIRGAYEPLNAFEKATEFLDEFQSTADNLHAYCN